MDLNDYFQPVSLEKPRLFFFESDASFSKTIEVHTDNNLVKDIDAFDIAIIGVEEERNSVNKGTAKAPDEVRGKLYQLAGINKKLNIIDLGNLKNAPGVMDTYHGLKDVILYLYHNNVIPIIIGGSQDLTISNFWASEKLNSPFSFTSVDSRFDFQPGENPYGSFSYLQKIFEGHDKIFDFTNLGYQTYFVSKEELKYLSDLGYQAKRLGVVQQDIPRVEPVIRDADFMSVDISAVRHSEAPGYFAPSPHGLYGEQLCQIARYAGLSSRLKSFGIYEINPTHDINQLTSNLAAQVIWYFIDGVSQRNDEIPGKNNNIKKFIVSLNNKDKIVFYRSDISERWWIEIPVLKSNQKNRIISCSVEDYEKTCNQEIPDIWIRFFNKLN